MDNFLDDYINDLYFKQNIGAGYDQLNLFSKKDYYLILKPVIELLKDNKDASLGELRNSLYIKSGIEEKLREYILQKNSVPGIVVSYGTPNYKETIVIGNQEELKVSKGRLLPNIHEMKEDTIFDLASVTKIFTSLSIMKLLEYGLIDLSDEVVEYDFRFKNLKGVTIYDLLCFNVPLKTNKRIDNASSIKEAEDILFNIEINHSDNNLHPYTDMGIMILKYIIEKVSGLNYYEFLENNFFKKYAMDDTYAKVPNYKLNRVASNNFDSKVLRNGEIITNYVNYPGIAYDKKAQVMGQSEGMLSGHAGLFSTSKDMTNLLERIIKGEVLESRVFDEFVKNRRGRSYIDFDGSRKYVQYFGYMVYSKHPILKYSEVFHALSGKSFAGAGWVGTQITADPINELYLFLGSNRAHNRITFVDETQKEKLVNIDGRNGIIMHDGSFKIDARDFAYKRDEIIIHPIMKLLLQYKMLEDIFNLKNAKTHDIRIIK